MESKEESTAGVNDYVNGSKDENKHRVQATVGGQLDQSQYVGLWKVKLEMLNETRIWKALNAQKKILIFYGYKKESLFKILGHEVPV